MGNIQIIDCRSVCGLNFLSSQDLTHSSLHLKPILKNRAQIPINFNSEGSINEKDNVLLLRKKERSAGDLYEKPLPLRRVKTQPLLLKERKAPNENDFKILQILGDSRYGRMCMVKKDNHDRIYAMKIIYKKRVPNSMELEAVCSIQKEILKKSRHPFIPQFIYSFENERKIFLVTEYMEGGRLDQILYQLTRFSEEITKFYSASVLLALEYLHEKLQIVHKYSPFSDLKPENVMFDSDGHIRLISFGKAEKLNDIKGAENLEDSFEDSPTSSSPEARMIDYWNFGCFVYELLAGKKPFPYGMEDSQIVKKPTPEGTLDWPQFISKNARDLITRLLNVKIEERLGYHGIQEIKKHPFFSQVNWDKMAQKSVYPPLNPLKFRSNIQQDEEDRETESECECEDNISQCSITFLSEEPSQKTSSDTETHLARRLSQAQA